MSVVLADVEYYLVFLASGRMASVGEVGVLLQGLLR